MVAVRQGEAKPDQHRDREEVVRTLRLRRTGSISSEETVSRRVRVREVARGGTGLNQTFMVMTDQALMKRWGDDMLACFAAVRTTRWRSRLRDGRSG